MRWPAEYRLSNDQDHLELTDRSGNSVRITVAERGAGQAKGDARLRVQVRSIGFEGTYDGVWMGRTGH
jgi:hypothetical protein